MAGGRPDEDLKQATFYAITKRTELQRKHRHGSCLA
jgi:hypothetical protein